MLILGLKGLSESLTICYFGPLTQKKKQRKRKPITISHFQVPKITFKTRLSAKISFIYMRVKNHFNVKWLYS